MRTLLLLRVTIVAIGLSLAAACASMPNRVGTAAASPTTVRQQWLEMFARGYFPGRSGQVFYVPHEGDFLSQGTDPLYSFMHGSPWPYDTRVPILFYGPRFIEAGEHRGPATQQDVAPTLATLLGAAAPATVTGRVLTAALRNGPQRPRVVVLMVLDGMRADYFDKYRDVLPTLSRMRREGAWFTDARANSIPTLTSVGHATLGTGTDPRVHGLVVNNLFNRISGQAQESYDRLDPRELMALTLADVWNIVTDGRAVIIGQGGAIRATAGLVGRGACQINGRRVIAASYATRTGGWETNDACYSMSNALKAVNGEQYWKAAGGTWMGHDIASGSKFRASSVFQKFEGDALVAVLEQEHIGADDVTDMVMINMKSPDYVGHAYGPDSAEIRETMAELDRQVARMLAGLEKKAGPDATVVAISGDHGMPGAPGPGRRRIGVEEVIAALDNQFPAGGKSLVQYFNDPANSQIHLDASRALAAGVSLKDIATFLESRFFAAVFTEDEVRAAQARLPLGQ